MTVIATFLNHTVHVYTGVRLITQDNRDGSLYTLTFYQSATFKMREQLHNDELHLSSVVKMELVSL
jgi:hypothetical protein